MCFCVCFFLFCFFVFLFCLFVCLFVCLFFWFCFLFFISQVNIMDMINSRCGLPVFVLINPT